MPIPAPEAGGDRGGGAGEHDRGRILAAVTLPVAAVLVQLDVVADAAVASYFVGGRCPGTDGSACFRSTTIAA